MEITKECGGQSERHEGVPLGELNPVKAVGRGMAAEGRRLRRVPELL